MRQECPAGTAYVLDTEHKLYLRVNKEMVSVEPVTEKRDKEMLRTLILEHEEATGSQRAREILENFEQYAGEFKKIVSRDESRMLEKIAALEAEGFARNEAELEAFLRRGE